MEVLILTLIRLNVVVISSSRDAAAVKTYWYSEVVSHGFFIR